MSDRIAATKELLLWVDALCPGNENVALYEKRLASMSDKAFGVYMEQLESGEEVISFVSPNLGKYPLTIERNLAVAKKLGHSFFERLRLTDAITGITYLTPVKYLVVDLPFRRQSQLLIKKISIPQDNKHVDDLTGQPTGVSKGSTLSFPELQILYAQNLEASIVELIKFRGGDREAFNAMNKAIIQRGGVSLKNIEAAGTKVKSTNTLAVILKAMHLDNNL